MQGQAGGELLAGPADLSEGQLSLVGALTQQRHGALGRVVTPSGGGTCSCASGAELGSCCYHQGGALRGRRTLARSSALQEESSVCGNRA